MQTIIITIGMDVHKETYALCSYFSTNQEFYYEETLKSESKYVVKYIRKSRKEAIRLQMIENHKNNLLLDASEIEVQVICGYEAGPTGFNLKRELEKANIDCRIMAPTTIYKKKGGNRVKTDKQDARNLSKTLFWGAYKEVVPISVEDEATRDYIRMRDDRKNALKKAKQQLKSFILRRNIHYPFKGGAWTHAYRKWLKTIKFDLRIDQLTFDEYLAEVYRLEEAIERFDIKIEELSKNDKYKEDVKRLRCFAGIDTHIALSIVCEVGDFARFKKAREFSSFIGLCPGEHSSGEKTKTTGITKSGNTHLRKLLIESCNSIARTTNYNKSKRLRLRQSDNDVDVITYADRGSKRIRYKFTKMSNASKKRNVAIAACARELACFIWGMMTNNIYGEIA